MTQNTFPEGRYVRYSKPEIPKKHMAWFVKMLIAFAVLLGVGVAYGFFRISNVPAPSIDVPAQGNDVGPPAKPASPPPAQ
jgi:hypothetical protein